jgi:hypothetical protein
VGTDRVYPTVPTCNGSWRLGWISRSLDLWAGLVSLGAMFRCQRVYRVAEREGIARLLDLLAERPNRPATSGRQMLDGYVTAIVAEVDIDKWYGGLHVKPPRIVPKPIPTHLTHRAHRAAIYGSHRHAGV